MLPPFVGATFVYLLITRFFQEKKTFFGLVLEVRRKNKNDVKKIDFQHVARHGPYKLLTLSLEGCLKNTRFHVLHTKYVHLLCSPRCMDMIRFKNVIPILHRKLNFAF